MHQQFVERLVIEVLPSISKTVEVAVVLWLPWRAFDYLPRQLILSARHSTTAIDGFADVYKHKRLCSGFQALIFLTPTLGTIMTIFFLLNKRHNENAMQLDEDGKVVGQKLDNESTAQQVPPTTPESLTPLTTALYLT